MSMEMREIPSPILVNEFMQIIDGQGRFTALKELNRPIQYMIYKGGTVEDCRVMNNAMTNWNSGDYIASYAVGGNESYVWLEKALNDCKMPLETILTAVGKGGDISADKKTRMVSKVNMGNTTFTAEDYCTATEVCRKIRDLWSSLARTDKMTPRFRSAASSVIRTPGYDHDKMKKCLIKHRHNFAVCGKTQDQMKEFSRVYNLGCRTKKINFEDYYKHRR